MNSAIECEWCDCWFVPGGKENTPVCAACYRDEVNKHKSVANSINRGVIDLVGDLCDVESKISKELSELREWLPDSALSLIETRGLQAVIDSLEEESRAVKESERELIDIQKRLSVVADLCDSAGIEKS